MEWIEPVDVKSSVKFSSSLSSLENDSDQTVIHGSVPESNLAWFASKDHLDIVSTKHSGVQSRHFQCSQGQDFKVTCVASIPNEPLMLVGLSSDTGSGAVALYNYVTSLILNSWSVSHKVTCVCSMEIPNASYKQFLKTDCFLFALGTEEGHIMLLAIDQHFKFSAGTHQMDLNIVHYVTTDDILHKRVFFKPPVVLVIPLNDPMYRGGQFVLESMHETQAVLSVKQEEVSATVVRYVPQNQTLCVGYNIQGAFQMFSLKTLDLDFSGFAQGSNGEQLQGILDFTFLEPEDDPRHFCYLVVVAEKVHQSSTSPYALLYSLTYEHKDALPEGGIVYETLQYITPRFDLNFGPLILSEQSDELEDFVELLTCNSLPSACMATVSNSNSTRAVTFDGLCYFALSCRNCVYLAIFDLNQWYQAQMPSRWIFDDMSTLCPFVGFYYTEMRGSSPRQVWIEQETLSIFHRSSTTPNETFFYPSALSFRALVVSPTDATVVLFLGIQSLLLQKLSQAGSQVLSHPHRFYVQAVKAGLTPTEIVAPHANQMAEALLNIGLENNSRAFLISCIKDEGANLNFVEKWAWQQVVQLKSLRESLCQMLFDHSAQEMEHQMHSQLYHVTHQFNNLAGLYEVMDKRIRALNSGVNDKLRDKSRAIYLLSLHLETVLWFLHGGLLPEVDEDEEETSSLPYPRRQLEQFYQRRKSEIEGLNSSVRASEVLLIEQLVPSSVVALWAEERGSNHITYPPPSLYALLSAYLRPDVDDVTKHRLVQYLFMDLTWIYGRHPHYGNILQHLVTFPSSYSLKPSVIKVTQAFWHLDHQNFDDALGMLLDPLVHTMDITNGQQRAILRSFLYQDKRRHALKYATLRQPVCPELEDIQLHLTILIANGLISDALGFIRRNRNQRNGTELIRHLLNGCQEMCKISVLLTLPLTDDEEEHVTLFLKQSRNLDLQEALLLFYIQRCKYPEAIAYSQRLNQMWPPRDATSRERFNRREMLMQTLVDALPPITCKLAAIANSRQPSTGVGGKFPRPLSVSVLPATLKVQSSGSNFFRTVIEQSRATWLIEQKLHQEIQTPFKTRKRKLEDADEDGDDQDRMELHSVQTTPFLCNIVQPSQRSNITLGMSLAFPSPKCVNMSLMDPDASEASMMEITQLQQTQLMDATQEPRQGKRPRYSLFPKAVTTRTDAEVISVLQTPPVRRSRPALDSQVDGRTSSNSNSGRPSSILKDKMRRFMDFSGAYDTGAGPGSSRGHPHGASDADPSESETDVDMEVSVVDTSSSAKHLRFNLPPAVSTSSPPSITESDVVLNRMTPEDVEEHEDMRLAGKSTMDVSIRADETIGKMQLSILGDESQFLSFEEQEAEPELQLQQPPQQENLVEEDMVQSTQPALDEMIEETIGRNASVLVSEQDEDVVQDEAVDVSNECEMELTELNATSAVVASSIYSTDPVEVEDAGGEVVSREFTQLEALHPMATIERRSSPVAGSDDSDESDIVCLNSSSEEGDVQDGEEMAEEEQDDGEERRFVVEGEEDEEEGLADDEEEEEEEDDDVSVEQESEAEDGHVHQPLAHVRDQEEMASNDSEMTETLHHRQEVDEEGDDEDAVAVPEEEEEIESAEVSHEEASASSSSSSPSKDAVEPGPRQTMSVSYKQRFTMSSSEDEEEEEEEEKGAQDDAHHPDDVYDYVDDHENEDQLDNTGRSLAPITGYSAVESDLESHSSDPEREEAAGPLPVAQSAAVAVPSDEDGDKEEVNDEDNNEGEEPPPTGYSQVEPDLDDDDDEDSDDAVESYQRIVPADESSSDSKVGGDGDGEENATSAALPADVSHESIEMVSDGEPGDDDGSHQSDEEEAEQAEEEEDEDFELRLTETPVSNVTARAPNQRRRFSMSSLNSSEGDSNQGEKSDLQLTMTPSTKAHRRTQVLIQPELSPTLSQSHAADSGDESQRRTTRSRARSSVFIKTRLQLSDSEESPSEEEEEQEDKEEPLASASRRDEQQEADTQSAAAVKRSSTRSPEGSSTDENEDLKTILQRHETVQVPLIPDAAIIPSGIDLSTIVEERTLDQSVLAASVSAAYSQSGLPSLTEEMEQEVQEPVDPEMEDEAAQQPSIQQGEVEESMAGQSTELKEADVALLGEHPTSTSVSASSSVSKLNELDAGLVQEPSFEPMQPLTSSEDEADDDGHKTKVSSVAEAEPKRKRGRPKSSTVRPSQVLLPFTARRTMWAGDRRSTSPADSVTSEPPQSLVDDRAEDSMDTGIRTRRQRRHSSSVSSGSTAVGPSTRPAPRRSKRLSASVSEGLDQEEEGADEPMRIPPVARTPIKSSAPTRRSSRRSGQPGGGGDDNDSIAGGSVPPSVEVSPSDSCYSGRSSAPGTPMRRSARLALRERTPEPSASTDALMAGVLSGLSGSSRVRRHSAGTAGGYEPSPLRRSGRKSSANVSRDNSPDSISSEPAPRMELTPSRRKPTSRTLKSAQKSVALNLFPVEEEELDAELMAVSSAAYYRDRADASLARDSDDSISHDDDALSTSSMANPSTTAEGQGKKPRRQRSRPPSSVSSSPGGGSSRYNLRRAGRQPVPELAIISEEGAGASASSSSTDPSATSHKRVRDEPAEEENSDQAGRTERNEDAAQSDDDAASTTSTVSSQRRVVRNKRRKKTSKEEQEEEEGGEQQGDDQDPDATSADGDDFRFAPGSRPPPKIVPKREPVFKPTRSTVRRSMRLDK